MNKNAMTVADIIDAVAKGRMGHQEAMAKLGSGSYSELVDTMHANGRTMWAHRRSAKLDAPTLEILRNACMVGNISRDVIQNHPA